MGSRLHGSLEKRISCSATTLKLPDAFFGWVNLEFTFFKLLPKKAELGTEPPAPELFKLSGVLLTAPMVEKVVAMATERLGGRN